MKNISEKKAFSIIKRAQSFRHAFRGIWVFISTQHNAWVHVFVMCVVVFLGLVFQISSIEWMMLVFSIGLVLCMEAVNTAIEFDIDLTSPEYHPFAKDTKDVAAGAVLMSVIVAVIIGLIIFAPKISEFLVSSF